jgi:hypothetical protein
MLQLRALHRLSGVSYAKAKTRVDDGYLPKQSCNISPAAKQIKVAEENVRSAGTKDPPNAAHWLGRGDPAHPYPE